MNEILRGHDLADAMDSLWANAASRHRAGRSSEEWRACPGYEGRYEVSDQGRIRSLPRKEFARNGVSRTIEGGVLRPMKHIDGYLQVSLRAGGKMRTVRLHRLIAEAFHGHLRNALHNEVAHLDGNPSNARASNLKWVSRRENMAHRVLHGTDDRGERHSSAKLTNAQAEQIRSLRGTLTSRELASRFGVGRRTIEDVLRGRRYHRLSRENGNG